MTAQKVLVVDDEEYIRDLVSSALRIAGFQTLVEPDGSRGLAVVAAQHPDLIVLDVGLPGIDGFEMCRRMRADGDATPVIFLTARDTAEDRVSQRWRRLPHQAVLARGAHRSGQGRPAPRPGRPAGGQPPHLRRPRDRRGNHAGHPGRPVDSAFADGVQAAALPARQPGASSVEEPDPRPRVAVRLRRERRGGRELHLLPAQKVDDVEPHLIQTVRGFGYVLRQER